MKKNRQAVIITKNLAIGYRPRAHRAGIVVHKQLDLSLCKGEVTCLLGLNGAGKSTLLRTLCGFQPPLGGEILLEGKALSRFSQRDFALKVGIILTERTNAGGLSVYELVSLGRHPYTGFFGHLNKQDHTVVRQAIEAVGMNHKAHNYVSELSDGERQKAMIAKVLAQECPIVMLDEPTAFLDVSSRIETMILLRDLARSQGKTILLSTHDLELAIEMADRLWLQHKDKPMQEGTPEDLILSGKLGHFFEKGKIHFNTYTGKLRTLPQGELIQVKGDRLTLHWMYNALTRKGFRPQREDTGTIKKINCISPTEFELTLTADKQYQTHSVEETLALLNTSPME